MPSEMDDERFRNVVAAFSDGLLDPRERIEFLNYVAAHPDAVHRIIAHEQFREDIRNACCQLSTPLPPSLNRRLSEVASAVSGRQD